MCAATPTGPIEALATALVGELAPPIRADHAALVERLVTSGLAAVRARFPEAPTPAEAFVAHVVACARRQADLVAALPRLRLDDLWLAWWASQGDAAGIAAFEATHAGERERLLRRFHRLDPDELTQRLRIKLFSATATQAPRALDYSGFGFLENWYRVIAARTFLDAARSHARDHAHTDALPDAALAALLAPDGDPRDAALGGELLAALKRALAGAIADLPPRDRRFLRHALVDELTVEQIATTYELHRVTVSRALSAARTLLHERARALVAAELGLAPDRLASALEALDSKLTLSLARVLATER